jgi:hypothetical protein
MTLLRESLGFGKLRGSHATCDLISIFCSGLLRVTRRVGCCEAVPHIRSDIVLRYAFPTHVHDAKLQLGTRSLSDIDPRNP